MEVARMEIEQIPEISAIYYALLQTGYAFYRLEKPNALVSQIASFQKRDARFPFFQSVKQSTCEVYPYWPRAAMLEAATFFLDAGHTRFRNLQDLKKRILSASNIKNEERGAGLWEWIEGFPQALRQVLSDKGFQEYHAWERDWIREQNERYTEERTAAQAYLDMCNRLYDPPVTRVKIVLNPIKCAYSTDYHIYENCLIFCSGAWSVQSVVHEFVHQIAHPVIECNREEILRRDVSDLGIDPSYYLAKDDAGRLNAFEEYFVRRLTEKIMADHPPDNLAAFLEQTLTTLDQGNCHEYCI